MLGPSPAALVRINNEFRFQILVKYKSEPGLLQAIQFLDDYYHEKFIKEKLALKIDLSAYDDVTLLIIRNKFSMYEYLNQCLNIYFKYRIRGKIKLGTIQIKVQTLSFIWR